MPEPSISANAIATLAVVVVFTFIVLFICWPTQQERDRARQRKAARTGRKPV